MSASKRGRMVELPDNARQRTPRPKVLRPEESFAAFLVEARHRMIWVLRKNGVPESVRDDITQGSMLALVEHGAEMLAKPRSERLAYAGLTVLNDFRNFVRDESRRHSRERRWVPDLVADELHEQTSDPEDHLLRREAISARRTLISFLPKRFRLVLDAHHFQGISTLKIADKLRIAHGTAKTSLTIAHKRLRRGLALLDEDGGGFDIAEKAIKAGPRRARKSREPSAGLTQRSNGQRNGSSITSGKAPAAKRSVSMPVVMNREVFDEFITGTATTWYSAAEYNDVLGNPDVTVVIAHTTNVTGAPSLSVYVDQSADNRTWFLSAVAGGDISIATLTENGTAQTDFSTLPYVRLRITLGGTNPAAGCRLRLCAAGRNTD